jgi:hypothetical protein
VDDADAMKDKGGASRCDMPCNTGGAKGGLWRAYPQGVIGPPLREFLEFLEFLKCLTVRSPRSRQVGAFAAAAGLR